VGQYDSARELFRRAATILSSRDAVITNWKTMQSFTGGPFPGQFVF
jgi:hypothetical protein